CASLRVEARGTGDGGGEFADFSPADWSEDISSALTEAAGRFPGLPLGLLGLRWGATMAARVADADERIAALALWQPWTGGGPCIAEAQKRKKLRNMLGEGRAGGAGEESEFLDLDGFKLGPRARQEMEEIDLLESGSRFAGSLLLAQISSAREPSGETLALADAFPQARRRVLAL
ncbi:MAG: hypothetical protein HQL31_09775, partial [Planctomycetes bacterium]|nr:hypothetical protein [Planctomycetota bacterium]